MEKRDYSNLPEHLPHGKLAFNGSTNELFIGAGENAPLQKVTNKEIEDELRVASIDYSGEHHANLKDSMDANVDFVMGEFNSVQMTGEYITAQNTIPRHVKRAELKGHTEVNLIQEPSGEDVVLPYSFEEGERVTINDTHVNGRVEVGVKGRTLVNVHQQTLGEITLPCDKKYRQYNIYVANNPMLMTNRTYLYILDVKKNTANSCALWNNNRNTIGKTSHISYPIEPGQIGRTVFKVNFKDLEGANNHRYNWLEFVSDLEEYTGEIVFTLNIIEYQEGMENWDIPYFEGMTSVQSPTIQTCGKNLFNPNNIVIDSSNTYGYIDLSKHETLTFSITDKDTSIDMSSIFFGATYQGYDYDGTNQNGGGWLFNNGEFVRSSLTTTQCKYFSFHPRNKATFDKIIARYSIQIEEGSTATTYERYQSSTLTLPEEIVLRGLPNGVCDTYNTKTKEYTQRIGEVVLDGSEDEVWYKYSNNTSEYNTTDKTSVFNISVNGKKLGYNTSICDTFKNTGSNKAFDMKYVEPFTYSDHPTLDNCYFDYGSNNNYTLNDFKVYLQQNPITVQYELATPIITKIDLTSFPRTYDTTTHIYCKLKDSSISPVISSDNTISYPAILKPNTKYSIITNPTLNNHTSTPISCNLGGASIEILPDSGNCHLITTPSKLAHSNLTFTDGDGHKLCGGVMLLEGDKTGMMFNYFEGMKSVENPIVKVTNGLDELTESYKSNALTIPTQLSLRSLPNGVCDTLDLITGEYVQRVWESVYNGDETHQWHAYALKDEFPDVIGFYHTFAPKRTQPLRSHYSGKLPTVGWLFPDNLSANDEGINISQGDHLKLSIYKNRLSSLDVSGFKQWLSNNPIRLQYQLAEPITTKLDLQWEDGKLFAYDGTTHFLVDIEGGHLYPVFDVDVPVNLSAEFSRLRAEKEQLQRDKDRLENQLSLVTYHKDTLYSNVQSLQTENSQLKTQAEDLQVKSNVLELKSGELEECTTRLTQSTAHLSEGLQFVDSTREKGDLELLSSDFDLDFRLMEIEFALDLTLPAQFRTKEVRNMARTPYEMAKTLILGGKYDREDMEFKLGRYLKRGQITQEQHDELLALMEANDLM